MEQPDGTQEIGKFMVRIGVIILICSYFWTQLIGMGMGLASAACHALVAPAVMLLAFRRGVGARVIPWLTLFALPVGMSTVSYALNGGGTEADPLLYQVPHGQRLVYWFYLPGFLLLAYHKLLAPYVRRKRGVSAHSYSLGQTRFLWLFFPVSWAPVQGLLEVAICLGLGALFRRLDGSAALFFWFAGGGLAYLYGKRALHDHTRRQDMADAEIEAERYTRSSSQREEEVYEARDFDRD